MFPRKITSASLSGQTIRAELRSAGGAASRAVRRHPRLTAAAAVTATAGASLALAAPWAGAAASPAASGHSSHAVRAAATAPSLSDVAARSTAQDSAAKLTAAAPATHKAAAATAAAPATGKPAAATAVSVAPVTGKPAAATAATPVSVAPMTVKPAAAAPATHKPAAAAAAAPVTQKAAAAPAARPAAKPAPAGPTTIYDSVTPSSIPAGQAEAVYADGTYQASAAQTAGHQAMWIDTNGSNTSASALDVEPGDATPAGAAAWVSAKLSHNPHQTAIVYTFKSDWGATQDDINALPSWMHSHVKYWIADPTGTRHMVPGAAATQWYWGASYDITAASPGFFQH